MESTQLASHRSSSTRRRSRPVFADIADHRPDSFGSVVRPETPTDSSLSTPPSHPAPVFPPEGIWDGGHVGERAIDNVEPHEPTKATAKKQPPARNRSRRGRLRRRWFGLLGALGGVILLMALSGHGHHGTIPNPGTSGVGMPTTLPGNAPVKPLRIALVLGNDLSAAAQAREVHALEGWLSGHVNPSTRLTIIDAGRHTATPALTPARWGSVSPSQPFQGTLAGVLARRLATGRGHRVLVTLNHPDPSTGSGLARLHLILREGADLPTTVPLRPGQTLTRAVDPDETQAFAATAARSVISISNMTEGGEE